MQSIKSGHLLPCKASSPTRLSTFRLQRHSHSVKPYLSLNRGSQTSTSASSGISLPHITTSLLKYLTTAITQQWPFNTLYSSPTNTAPRNIGCCISLPLQPELVQVKVLRAFKAVHESPKAWSLFHSMWAQKEIHEYSFPLFALLASASRIFSRACLLLCCLPDTSQTCPHWDVKGIFAYQSQFLLTSLSQNESYLPVHIAYILLTQIYIFKTKLTKERGEEEFLGSQGADFSIKMNLTEPRPL